MRCVYPNLTFATVILITLTVTFYQISTSYSHYVFQTALDKYVTAYQYFRTPMWALKAHIDAPEIQCATGVVTATFTLDKTTSPVEVRAVTGPTPVSHSWSRDDNMVTLEAEWTPRKNGCIEPSIAKLTVHLYCDMCDSITGVVNFSTNIPHLAIRKRGSPTKAWRLAAPVNRAISVCTTGGSPFTAVFKFPPLPGKEIKSFVARPRTLLEMPDAWFTQNVNGSSLVYAALRLPDGLDGTTSSFPEIIIDVECETCDMQKASLAYTPARPEWDSIIGEATLMEFNQNEGERVPLKETFVMRSGSKCEMIFQTGALSLWNSGYQGFVHITIEQPVTSKPEFSWELHNVRHNAKVYTSRTHYFVQLSPGRRGDVYSIGNASLTLHMTLEECDQYRSAETYLPSRPIVPRGVSEIDRGMISVVHEGGAYKLRGGMQPRVLPSTFRLWINKQKIPSNVKSYTIENIKDALRLWENQLNAYTFDPDENLVAFAYDGLISGDYYHLIDGETSYGEGRNDNTGFTSDLQIGITPSLYKTYGSGQWSVETSFAQETADDLCSRRVVLAYTVRGLPTSLVPQARVFVSEHWVARTRALSSLQAIILKQINCQTSIQALRFYLDCGGPCDKPEIEVAVAENRDSEEHAMPLNFFQ